MVGWPSGLVTRNTVQTANRIIQLGSDGAECALTSCPSRLESVGADDETVLCTAGGKLSAVSRFRPVAGDDDSVAGFELPGRTVLQLS